MVPLFVERCHSADEPLGGSFRVTAQEKLLARSTAAALSRGTPAVAVVQAYTIDVVVWAVALFVDVPIAQSAVERSALKVVEMSGAAHGLDVMTWALTPDVAWRQATSRVVLIEGCRTAHMKGNVWKFRYLFWWVIFSRRAVRGQCTFAVRSLRT